MTSSYYRPQQFAEEDENLDHSEFTTTNENSAEDSHEHESFTGDDLEEGHALVPDEDGEYFQRRRRRMMIMIAVAGFIVLLIIATIVGVVVGSSKKSSVAPPPVTPSTEEPAPTFDTNNTKNTENTTQPSLSVQDAPEDLYGNCISSEAKDLLSCQKACNEGACCYSKDVDNCFAQFPLVCSDYEACKFADFSSLGDSTPDTYTVGKPVTSIGGEYYSVPDNFTIVQPTVVEKPPVGGFTALDSSGLLQGLGGDGTQSIDIVKVCSSDNVKTSTGKEVCNDACMKRECCFATEEENCASMYPTQYCKGYDACLILKINTTDNTESPEAEAPLVNPDTLVVSTNPVALDGLARITPADAYCNPEQMNTQKERDKCQEVCANRDCCFSDGPDYCGTMFPQDCAEYQQCNNLYDKLKEIEAAANAPPPLTPEEQLLNATQTHQMVQDYYLGVAGDNVGSVNGSATDSFLSACSEENLSRGDQGQADCMNVCNTRSCCFSQNEKVNCELDHADWCAEFSVCKKVMETSTATSQPTTDVLTGQPLDNAGPSDVDLASICASDLTVTVEGSIACSNACSQKSCCKGGKCAGDPSYCQGYDLCNESTFADAIQLSAQPESTSSTAAKAPTASPTKAPLATATSAPTSSAVDVPPDIASVCDPSQLSTVDGYNACEVACSPASCCNQNDAVDCDQRVCLAYTICKGFWSALSPEDNPADALGLTIDQTFSDASGAAEPAP